MNSLYEGLTVPKPCPHCGYVIEHPVGEQPRDAHCPRCGLTLTVEEGPAVSGEGSVLGKLAEKLLKPK